MMRKQIIKYKSVCAYGLALAAALLFLKWLEWRFLIVNYLLEIYTGIIAAIFTGLGIWLAIKLGKQKALISRVEDEAVAACSEFVPNDVMVARLGISVREMEVLELMAGGLSNQEIAERLFLSLSTIKTHLSNLFDKLEARRRTQAVEKARRLGLIP